MCVGPVRPAPRRRGLNAIRESRLKAPPGEGLTNYVLAIAAAISGLVVQQGFTLRTLPLSVLVIVIGLDGALAAAKYHERASYHLFQACALMRRWRSSARPTTANTSRLNRRRLHQLCGPGCTLASARTASCWSSSPSRSDGREQSMSVFTQARHGQGSVSQIEHGLTGGRRTNCQSGPGHCASQPMRCCGPGHRGMVLRPAALCRVGQGPGLYAARTQCGRPSGSDIGQQFDYRQGHDPHDKRLPAGSGRSGHVR